jgi:hypothetical protein
MAFYIKRAYFVNLSLGKLALCVSISVSSIRGSHRLTLAAVRGSNIYRSLSSKFSNLRALFDASAYFLVVLDLIIFACLRLGWSETSTYITYPTSDPITVYVDESGCDKRISFRRTGWSPVGATPLQVSKFHRDQRYQILPAYAQDGVVFSRVFQGSTMQLYLRTSLSNFSNIAESELNQTGL